MGAWRPIAAAIIELRGIAFGPVVDGGARGDRSRSSPAAGRCRSALSGAHRPPRPSQLRRLAGAKTRSNLLAVGALVALCRIPSNTCT